MRELQVLTSADLTDAEREELTRLCAAAFREPWADEWHRLGPAVHVVARMDGSAVSHACFIERELHVAHAPLRAAYVEAVATLPGREREGHGTAVMERIGSLIVDGGYELGALSTGSHAFYERFGWERWQGPSFIRMPDGEQRRTPDEDDGVMVLRTPASPPDLDVRVPISVPWRPGEVW